MYKKFSDLMRMYTYVLPVEFLVELEHLQDGVPARPLDEDRAPIRKQLSTYPEAIVADFDVVPMRSASLAHVHVAHMPDGHKVAVKVQLADIEEISLIDLAIIGRVFEVIQIVVRIRGMEEYPTDIAQMIREELDFRREARNIETLAANF